ncbi:MAG: hypothetical protein H0W06_01615 [Chloroflexia bacterium]|nr:hypothetical protein [Chloroflexia bacterium]
MDVSLRDRPHDRDLEAINEGIEVGLWLEADDRLVGSWLVERYRVDLLDWLRLNRFLWWLGWWLGLAAVIIVVTVVVTVIVIVIVLRCHDGVVRWMRGRGACAERRDGRDRDQKCKQQTPKRGR